MNLGRKNNRVIIPRSVNNFRQFRSSSLISSFGNTLDGALTRLIKLEYVTDFFGILIEIDV